MISSLVEEDVMLVMVLLKDFRPFRGRVSGDARQVENAAVLQ